MTTVLFVFVIFSNVPVKSLNKTKTISGTEKSELPSKPASQTQPAEEQEEHDDDPDFKIKISATEVQWIAPQKESFAFYYEDLRANFFIELIPPPPKQ
ncbi:MAG: hypothetical protein JST48_13000 [Bacteroidetes bacterium]|nr:hypothetical protein [Bacteroidota bacterium]